jgi:hypothetical protein
MRVFQQVVPSPAAAALVRVTAQLLRGGGSVLLVGAAGWVVRNPESNVI